MTLLIAFGYLSLSPLIQGALHFGRNMASSQPRICMDISASLHRSHTLPEKKLVNGILWRCHLPGPPQWLWGNFKGVGGGSRQEQRCWPLVGTQAPLTPQEPRPSLSPTLFHDAGSHPGLSYCFIINVPLQQAG